MIIKTDKLYIKLLEPEDVNEEYQNWLKNPEIYQYLETKWKYPNLEDLKAYITKIHNSNNDFMFGIYLTKDDKYIGNIKIGNVNWIHRYAEIGLIIGDQSEWGKGYAADSINLATKYAFEHLNLHKLWAGMYESNTGSLKAFKKAGYSNAGTFKAHGFVNGKYEDVFLVEILNKQ
ncbi:MAG: GNAT family protein [Ignavibacteriae bacterium]|nr:GNAT family protein [Ignavibacteriota bacterium]